MRILGYADRLSVPAGGRIEFKVSCELPEFAPSLVRLRRGGSPVHECDLLEEDVDAPLPATVPGRVQVARAGSFVEARVRDDVDVAGAGLAVWIFPTLLHADREQTVLALLPPDGDGYRLAVTAGGVVLRGPGGAELSRLDVAPVPNQWSFLTATATPDGGSRLTLHRPGRGAPDAEVQESHIPEPAGPECGFPEPPEGWRGGRI
ncbi:MAG: hypothetical protein ACRDQ0_14550, partial [Pseudonocardia sp.]